jgi:hypothetical protein
MVLSAAIAVSVACNVQGDAEGVVDDLPDADIGEIEICDGMTLEELTQQNTLSDNCRAQIESYLPQPENNFESKLVVLGTTTDASDGSKLVYLHGTDASGMAFDATDYAALKVEVTVAGQATLLAEGTFTLSAVAQVPADQISVGIVNDYSGSMQAADLTTISGIETDLFTYLPPVYEAEVTLFSTEVMVKQPFTSDKTAILAAVGRDETFMRDATALYDGMGTGLDSLVQRQRPVRLLIVATDGLENASTTYTKDRIIQTVNGNGVAVLMLGALFADVSEMRQLMGNRGFFFYTRLYDDMRAALEQYLKSLENMVELRIPADQAAGDSIRVEVDGVSTPVE